MPITKTRFREYEKLEKRDVGDVFLNNYITFQNEYNRIYFKTNIYIYIYIYIYSVLKK